MSNFNRIIGVNVYDFMQRAGFSPEELAKNMSYSLKDVWNIIEGKVMLPPSEIEKIATFLGVSKEELIAYKAKNLAPNLEFMKVFSNPDNLDTVLDLMDEYVELREVL